MSQVAVPVYKMQGDFSIDIRSKKSALYMGNYIMVLILSLETVQNQCGWAEMSSPLGATTCFVCFIFCLD